MKTELVVAIIAAVVALASGVGTIWGQFRVTTLQAELEHRREIRRPFLERQLTLYFEAAKVASQITNPLDQRERKFAVQRFWQLYWGELAVVEDPEVAGAMVAFGRELRASGDRGRNSSDLQKLGLELSHACRSSLQKSWNVNLGATTRRD